jgi:AcrR family transcriptional regulator
MSSTADNASTAATARRPHDAEATRRALLEAARALFDEVGYDRATTREIGERAGVDPALIARYFDCKEGLCLAAIAEGPADEGERIDPDPEVALAFLLQRWDERGRSPIGRALTSPALTDEVRGQVRKVMSDRVTGPLAAELDGRGIADSALRAELLVALALGIAVTRGNGSLEALAGASREEVLAVLGPLVAALASS